MRFPRKFNNYLENKSLVGRFCDIKEINHQPTERIGVEMRITTINQIETIPLEICNAQKDTERMTIRKKTLDASLGVSEPKRSTLGENR